MVKVDYYCRLFGFLIGVLTIVVTEQVVQCPNHPKTGCSPPKWDVRWDMAGSGYVYCFGTCPLPWLANHTELGTKNFGAIVGVDHYYTHQGMPCVNGLPREFEMQDEFARQTKTTFPRTRVLEYRITDAVPYAPIVHDLMVSKPEYFVRWHNPPHNNGSVCTVPAEHQTGRPGDNCNWEIRAGAYDFAQQQVRDWFLENIIKPTMVYADGAWIDGDGPDNGAYQCSGSYDYGHLPAPYPALNETEIAAFCDGEAQVTTASQQWLIANGGYEYDCLEFIGSGLPSAADSADQCAAKLKGLDHKPTQTAIVLYGDRTQGKGYNDSTAAQAVAVFLLVRGDYWYFGLPAANSLAVSTAQLLLTDYGMPLTNMTETVPGSFVFERVYEHAVVSFDCANFTATFTPK
jgi:hypothetical protein